MGDTSQKWPKTISQRILCAAKCNDVKQLATFDVPFSTWQDMSMDIVRASNHSYEVMDFLHGKKIKFNPKLIRSCHTLNWFVSHNQLPSKEKLQALALQSHNEDLVIVVKEIHGRYHPAMRLDIARLFVSTSPNNLTSIRRRYPAMRLNMKRFIATTAPRKSINRWPLRIAADEQDERDMIDLLLKRKLYDIAESLIDQGWRYNVESVTYQCPPHLYVKTHPPLPRDAFENAIRNQNFNLAAYILQSGQPQDLKPLLLQ